MVMTTPTIPYKWIDPDYVKWSDKKMNDSLKTSLLNPLKNCTNVNRYTRASRTHGKFIICPHCNKVQQYITLVGQHLVAKSVVLW